MTAPTKTVLTTIVPLLSGKPDEIQTYWQTLYMHDLLRKRLCDVMEPTWSDVLDMIRRLGKDMYMVHVAGHDDGPVGEFMLENRSGNAMQIHFSAHPDLTWPEVVTFMKDVTQQILTTWSILDTLYGLTPVTNRAACITVLKVGFKKLGILPMGMRDQGTIVDAMITVKTRADYGK